eukprot:1147357-Pelagomonas_calceolata.AAC.8
MEKRWTAISKESEMRGLSAALGPITLCMHQSVATNVAQWGAAEAGHVQQSAATITAEAGYMQQTSTLPAAEARHMQQSS